MDLSWIYRGFFVRDVLGYMLPGSIALFALIRGLDPRVVSDLFWDPEWWVVTGIGVPLAYVAGMVIQTFGLLTHLLVTDHARGALGDPAAETLEVTRTFWWFTWQRWPKCLWSRCARISEKYKARLVQQFRLIATTPDLSALVDVEIREIAFMHISGSTSVALAVLCLSRFWAGNPGCDAAAWLQLLYELTQPGIVWWVLLASAIVLWLEHYRHCRNFHLIRIILRDIVRNRNASTKPE